MNVRSLINPEDNTIEFEGVMFQAFPDDEIQPGDTYLAARNTGVQLLTCRENVPRPTEENGLKHGGWIHAVEMVYSYNTHECVKVEMID